MVAVKFENFGGRIPRISSRLLPQNQATVATNMDVFSGEIVGVRAGKLAHSFPAGSNYKKAFPVRALVDEIAQASNITWYGSRVLESQLIRSPLTSDTIERWYLFEKGTAPRVITYQSIVNGSSPSKLAIANPVDAPTVRAASTTEPQETRVYVFTYQTSWGEETGPSPPATVTGTENGEYQVSDFVTANRPPVVAGRDIQYINLYRTVSTLSSVNYYLVEQIPWSDRAETYADVKTNAEVALGAILTTTAYTPPPDSLYGAVVHPSGSMVAFSGRDVYFSVPYKPHSWPDLWRISVQDPVVGLAVYGQNVLVATTGRPVILYGNDPSTQGKLEFQISAPCLSGESIVLMPDGAFYASTDGIVRADASGVRVISEPIIEDKQWQSTYASTTLSAAWSNNRYLARYGSGAGVELSFTEPQHGLVDHVFSDPIESFAEDYFTGDVFYVSADNVYWWDSPDEPPLEWTFSTKEFMTPKPTNFGVVQPHMLNSSETVRFKLYERGRLVFDEVLLDGVVRRLPAGYLSDIYRLEMSSTGTLQSLKLATTPMELEDV